MYEVPEERKALIRENDKKYVTVVDDNTIIIDFRGVRSTDSTQSGQARAMANRHFNNEFDVVLKRFEGYAYHVRSVKRGMWVLSLNEMTPQQTVPIIKQFVDCDPKK